MSKMQMPKRPKGITILSILMILSGLFGLVTVALFGRPAEDNVGGFVSPTVLVTFGLLLAGGNLVGGIGMWIGKKWGFWLTVMVMAFTILTAISGFLNVDAIGAQFAAADSQIMAQKIKFVGRIISTGLVLTYLFFRNSVRVYFQAGVP